MPTGTTLFGMGLTFGFPNSSTKWGLGCAVTDKNNPALGTRHVLLFTIPYDVNL